MNNLQKMGGIASLTMATVYLVGFVIFFLFLDPGGPLTPVESVEFLSTNQQIIYLTMLFIYVLCGFVLAVLVQALYERLKVHSPALMQTTTVFGFIWAAIVIAAGMVFIMGMDTVIELYAKNPDQAATVWLTVGIVFDGMGGGTEIVGGIWVFLISLVALRSNTFPKSLNYLGFLIGVAGIVTIIPGLEDFTAIFGLGQIPWFIWLGYLLIRDKKV